MALRRNIRRKDGHWARWPVTLAVMALLVAACGSGEAEVTTTAVQTQTTTTDTQPSATGDSSEPETVTTEPSNSFAGEEITVFAHTGHDAYLPHIIEAFEAETGATVNFVSADYGGFDALYATIATSQDPEYDVLYGNAFIAPKFEASGLYEDLYPLVDPAIVEGMVPVALEASTWNGKLQWLAMDSPLSILLYNTEHYEAAGLDPDDPPETWEEFVSYSEALRDNGPAAYPTFFTASWGTYITLINSTESSALSEDRRTILADTPESIEVLTAINDMFESGIADPAGYATDVSIDAGAGFTQEEYSHYFGFSTHYGRSQNPETSLVVDKVRTALIPGMELRSGSIAGNEGFGINSASENKELALAFVEFTHSPDMQRYIALEWGRGPGQESIREELAADPGLAEEQPAIATVLEQAQYPADRYGSPVYFDLENLYTEEINRMVTGQQSVEETAANLQRRGQELLDTFWASADN